ncbi:MAG: restriction endonuclease subunit S [Opitutales bacterium]|nr:restriction endonuclease subunit S [Opitutales bacterium]
MNPPHSTLADLQPNPEWAKLPLFDRKGWKRVRFDQLAQSVNERVEPAKEPEAIYVGLEHLETQNLHIRKWGQGSDVTGAKLRFRKGDIIFGRRRAYQRKLAVAEFDGICSAHAMVVRATPEIVLPEFLPFLMMSDRFMNRAVEISVGSLSPTINWKTLKLEEFDLPPLDQQRRLAEILWAIDQTAVAWGKVAERAEGAKNAYANQSFRVSVDSQPDGIEVRKLGDVFEVRMGGTPSRKVTQYWNGSIPWVKTGEVNYTVIETTEESITQEGSANSAAKIVPSGSVLMALYGQGPTLGRVAILGIDASVNQACAVIFPRNDYKMRYLFHYLSHQYSAIRKHARGASQPNINGVILKKFSVPFPSQIVQSEIADQLDHFDNALATIARYINHSKLMLQEISNSILH